MSASDVNTAAAAAVAAIEDGDWATAETKVMAALAYLAVLPDSTLGGSAGAGSMLTYDRTALQRLLTEVRRNRNAAAIGAAGGMRTTKVKYAAETSDSDSDNDDDYDYL